MLSALKRKLESKKQKHRAVADSQHWKHNPSLQSLLQQMRGSCTVVPLDLHEAMIAVVNIALIENNWNHAAQIPEDFLPQTVYIVWNDAFLPVLKADRDLLLQNEECLTTVASDTYLVSETMDRVCHLGNGTLRLYSVAPEG